MRDVRYYSRLHDELQDRLDEASTHKEARHIKKQIMANYIDMKKAKIDKPTRRAIFGYRSMNQN